MEGIIFMHDPLNRAATAPTNLFFLFKSQPSVQEICLQFLGG